MTETSSYPTARRDDTAAHPSPQDKKSPQEQEQAHAVMWTKLIARGTEEEASAPGRPARIAKKASAQDKRELPNRREYRLTIHSIRHCSTA